jgi:hypothetical protein
MWGWGYRRRLDESFGWMAKSLSDIADALSAAEESLYELKVLLRTLVEKGTDSMAIAQEILDAVTAETTVIDSCLKLMQGLIDEGTVTPEEGAAILAAISANKAALEAAILANTPAAPPVEPPVEPV